MDDIFGRRVSVILRYNAVVSKDSSYDGWPMGDEILKDDTVPGYPNFPPNEEGEVPCFLRGCRCSPIGPYLPSGLTPPDGG